MGFEAATNNNRNNTAINGANGVNNQFGAGESATILGRPLPPLQWGIPDITFPGTTRPVAPRYIHIGSSEPSGKNIVINSYNGGGDIQGWINQVIQAGNCHANTGWVLSVPSWPDCTISYSNVAGKTGLFHPSSLQNGWKVNSYTWGHTHGSGGCAVSVGGGPWYFSKWGTFAPYTTNQNTVDDGVHLVQTIGQAVSSDPTWINRGAVRTANLSGTTTDLELYRRPTTVAISPGYSYFTEFKIEDVEWWYNTYDVRKYDFSDSQGPHETYCNNYSNSKWVSGSPGHDEYIKSRDHYGIKSSHTYYDVDWRETKGLPGATKLDAAIQLMAGADVCVENNVEDATTSIQSKDGYTASSLYAATTGATTTDALLVLPASGNNFRLKVGGKSRRLT